VQGVAWAGEDSVETVEVSPDSGETWQTAEFVTVVDITPRGRILSLSVDYIDARTGEPASITLTYSRFGSVDDLDTRSNN